MINNINYSVADKTVTTSNVGDKERIRIIKKISVEQRFYNACRRTTRILRNLLFLQVHCNALLNGNLHILQNYEIEKNLKIIGNLIQMGLVDHTNHLYNVNLHGLV